MTFDEQLYCKAKMLQWHRRDDCQDLVILLGIAQIVQSIQPKSAGKYVGRPNSGLTCVYCVCQCITMYVLRRSADLGVDHAGAAASDKR